MAELSSGNSTTTVTVSSNNVKYYADTAKNYRDESKEYYLLAKDWAVKTDDTVDGSEYSSKYYALAAATSAESAAISETNAATSEANASQSEANAETSAQTAETAAEAALASETNAAASEANAATSETNAAASEANATESEANAAESEANAKSYAELAKDWANKTDDTVDGEEYSAKYYAEQTAAAASSAITDITSAEETALSSISSAQSTAEETIETGAESISTLTSESTASIQEQSDSASESITAALEAALSDIASAQANAEYVVSNLDKINQSKALETGALSSDEDVYEDVLNYAHSSFDGSKFTVTGSPTVTDDGIASGFSSTNYLSADFDTIDMTTDTFRIKGRATWVDNFDESSYPMIFSFINSSIRLHCASNSRFYLYYASDSGTTSGHSIDITGMSFYDNMEFDFDCYWDGATATCTITLDGIEYTNSASYTDYDTDEISTVYIGVNSNLIYPWGGSVDLKKLEIEKNGETIFSGNKTGTDTIKEDDYTSAGSPTVSDDGVYTCSTSAGENYITLSIPDVSNFSFEGYIQTKTGQPQGYYWGNSNSTAAGLFDCFYNSQGQSDIRLHLSDETTISGSAVKYDFGDLLKYNISYDGTTYTIVITDVTQGTTLLNFSQESDVTPLDYVILGGISETDTTAVTPAIDLNRIKIYSNGNLVYQPCLKIPYTQSRTGSKVVNYDYINRVQDVYDEYGYAPYYTIDEENQTFSLPMGEIYGMINKICANTESSTNLSDYVTTSALEEAGYVTSSEVAAAVESYGYQTEDEVNALITAALEEVENGTY